MLSETKAVDPMSVARAVAFVIGADGRASDEERASYETYLRSANIDAAAAALAEEWLKQRPEFDAVIDGLKASGDAKLALLRALDAAHADDRYSSVELEAVERIASALGVDPQTLSELESRVVAARTVESKR